MSVKLKINNKSDCNNNDKNITSFYFFVSNDIIYILSKLIE
jgi:hypothetical protein